MLLKYNDYEPSVEPTSYSVNYEDVDGGDTSESETGVSLIHVVRLKKAKISVSYKALRTSDLSAIMAQLSEQSVNITYFDGALKTAEMRCKSPSINMISNVDGGYWNLSFDLKEL